MLPAELIGLLALAALIVPLSRPVLAETYIVAVNHAPPYRIIEETGTEVRHSGIYIDLMKELAGRSGIEITFKNVPFRRALALIEQGAADLMLGPNRVPERELYMAYLDVELTRERKVFYVGKGAPDIAAYGDLAERRIAVLRGSAYFDRFDQDETLRKVEVADYATALGIVESGRVETVIVPELLGDYLISEGALSLRKASYAVEGRPSFIAISRKSALLGRAKELEAALLGMKRDGTVDAIHARYATPEGQSGLDDPRDQDVGRGAAALRGY